MTCNDCFEAFSCAIDGELEPELQQAMNDHLEGCADCRHLQTRMLAISVELKSQPFPAPDPSAVQKLAVTALSEATSVSWGWLRRLLRFPFERALPRTALRTLISGSMLFLVIRVLLVDRLKPLYEGVEAVAVGGMPTLSEVPGWVPAESTLWFVTAIVLVLGLWTAGLPGLLVDLWSGTRLIQRDIARLSLSAILLGPVAALPLVARLEFGLYSFACCAWAGAVLFLGFIIVAFKTQRALPKLAVDFAILSLLLGCLEVLARKSLSFPGPAALNESLQILAGNIGYSALASATLKIGLAGTLLSVALWSMVRSYRSQGSGKIAFAALLGFGFALYAGMATLPWGPVVTRASEPTLTGDNVVYLLGSTAANPWTLSNVAYPELGTDSGRVDLNQRSRARLASALLHWDEDAQLAALDDWSTHSEGVTWGMVSFVESLGERKGDAILVPTEARRKAVSHLLQTLRWRKLDDVVLSPEGAVISGNLDGAGQMPLRLIPLDKGENIPDALQRLSTESDWAKHYASQLPADWREPTPRLITVRPEEGRFRFSHLEPGRYLLAVLSDKPRPFTLNSSVPGVIEVKAGHKLDLGTVRLTEGTEGDTVPLSAERWRTEGAVSFSKNSEAATARLELGGTISGFVDTKVFAGGRAVIKAATLGDDGAAGRLTVRFYSKDGRQAREWATEIAAGRLQELEVDSNSAEGYIQVLIQSTRGTLTVKEVKVEVLSRG